VPRRLEGKYITMKASKYVKKPFFFSIMLLVASLTAGCLESDSGGGGLGQTGEGGGFVWKPRSESDGRLVVLLPPQYRGNVKSAHIANENGGVIELGRFDGDNHNANRPHYRFGQHGASYGNNIYVVADLERGGTVNWSIPRGGSRTVY
jgi:hypothetical protein